MDTTMTLWQLRSLMKSTKNKYLHFDCLYKDTIEKYKNVNALIKFAKNYVKEHKGQENDEYYKKAKADIISYTRKLKFAQDDIRMYKNEMHKWRDISTKLERAYWSTYHKLDKVWHVTEDGQFGSWIKEYNYVPCISNRFIGADTKLHLRITWYNITGCHHQVMVSLLDQKFGVLTNEHIY